MQTRTRRASAHAATVRSDDATYVAHGFVTDTGARYLAAMPTAGHAEDVIAAGLYAPDAVLTGSSVGELTAMGGVTGRTVQRKDGAPAIRGWFRLIESDEIVRGFWQI